jgi:DNA-binding winged helix-turn-helix (wHTH) protein
MAPKRARCYARRRGPFIGAGSGDVTLMTASDGALDNGLPPAAADSGPTSRSGRNPQSPDGRIELAREPPLRLGPLGFQPSLRRIAHDDGREEVVEPRVMQVLVALIRAGGQIVSRDDLMMSCWHGVVVGEDAINRVMGRVRRLADGIGDGEIKLETVIKVGYRLVACTAGRTPGPPRSRRRRTRDFPYVSCRSRT